MSKNFYEDEYASVFTDYTQMTEEIKALDETTKWIPGIMSKAITLKDFEQLEAQEAADKCGVSYDVAFDTSTTEGTSLMLNYGGKSYMVRNTAIDTILETAKINGSALSRMSPYLLSEVLNRCLSIAKGNSLLLIRGDKLCACLSDNIYKVMPIMDILSVTEDTLKDKFGNIRFVIGENNHEYTSALWELPDAQDKIMETYDKLIPVHSHRLHGRNFMPAVRFITSDIGKYAATLIPIFKMPGGIYFRINSGIKVAHKIGSGDKVGMDAYEEEIQGIFAKFTDVEKTMQAMAKTYIHNPVNAMIGMLKKAGIGKRLANDAVEEIERFACGRGCYMDDIYLSIAGITDAAKKAKMSGSRLLDLEENISKILYYKWSDFDVAGTVAWN